MKAKQIQRKKEVIIPIEKTISAERWVKIRGLAHNLWSSIFFTTICTGLGGMVRVSAETLTLQPESKAHYFRVSIGGDIHNIPAVVVTEIDGVQVVLTVQWDYDYSPSVNLSSQEYSQEIVKFDGRLLKVAERINSHTVNDSHKERESENSKNNKSNDSKRTGRSVNGFNEEDGSWVFVPRGSRMISLNNSFTSQSQEIGNRIIQYNMCSLKGVWEILMTRKLNHSILVLSP